MNSSCWRTTKKSFLAYVGNVVRVCTVNLTLSFSLSASDISTSNVFSANGMEAVGVVAVLFVTLLSPSTDPCCLICDDICSGGVPEPASDTLATLSPLSPFSSPPSTPTPSPCSGLPFVVSSALSYNYPKQFNHEFMFNVIL